MTGPQLPNDGHLRSPVKCLQLVHLTGWLVVAIKTSHLTHLKRSKLLFSYFQKRWFGPVKCLTRHRQLGRWIKAKKIRKATAQLTWISITKRRSGFDPGLDGFLTVSLFTLNVMTHPKIRNKKRNSNFGRVALIYGINLAPAGNLTWPPLP
jgi:hypothetical protein